MQGSRCLARNERQEFFLAKLTPPGWCLAKRKWPYVYNYYAGLAQRHLDNKNFAKALAAADEARGLGIPKSGKLRWDVLGEKAWEERNQGQPVTSLMTRFSAIASIRPEDASEIFSRDRRKALLVLSYAIAQLHQKLGYRSRLDGEPHLCDKFATLPDDPLRSTAGTKIADIKAQPALAACDAAVAAHQDERVFATSAPAPIPRRPTMRKTPETLSWPNNFMQPCSRIWRLQGALAIPWPSIISQMRIGTAKA